LIFVGRGKSVTALKYALKNKKEAFVCMDKSESIDKKLQYWSYL
jgi:hypothetical protein